MFDEASVQRADRDDDGVVSRQRVHGWEVLVVHGVMTDDAANAVHESVEEIARERGALIIDLSRARAVSAAFFRILHQLSERVFASGGDVRLVVESVEALRTIREAGLSGQFRMHRYVGDVLGAVAGVDERGRAARRAKASAPIGAHAGSAQRRRTAIKPMSRRQAT